MPTKIFAIAAQNGKNELSKGQKLFNKLIKKIEQERQLLRDWQENISHYQIKYAEKYRPLWQSFDDQRVKMLCLLDVIYFDKALDKQDKAKLKHIIADLAAAIVRSDSDEEVKRIYNSYTDSDFDAKSGDGAEAVKRLFEEKFDVDLGDDFERSSPKKMMAQLREIMQEKIQGEASLAEENAKIKEAKKAMRNKTEKALAKEAKQHENKQNISQSIREVFRKLASALHPDKEQDDTERKRKTALMQRVNIAYGNNDLLTLLELQLECEQIDATMLGVLSEDRLKYYNKILTEQSKELQQETMSTEMDFRRCFGIDPDVALSPNMIVSGLDAEMKYLQQNIGNAKKDLVACKDIKNVKTWLKSYQMQPKSLSFGDVLAELMAH